MFWLRFKFFRSLNTVVTHRMYAYSETKAKESDTDVMKLNNKEKTNKIYLFNVDGGKHNAGCYMKRRYTC